MWTNPQLYTDLVKFANEILNEKFKSCAVPKTEIEKQNTVIEIETLMFARK